MLTSFITSTIWCGILREANKDRSFMKRAATPCNSRRALLRMPLLSKTNSLTISNFRESWEQFCPFRVFISGCMRGSEPFLVTSRNALGLFLIHQPSPLRQMGIHVRFKGLQEKHKTDTPEKAFPYLQVQLGLWVQSVHQLPLSPTDLARVALASYPFYRIPS